MRMFDVGRHARSWGTLVLTAALLGGAGASPPALGAPGEGVGVRAAVFAGAEVSAGAEVHRAAERDARLTRATARRSRFHGRTLAHYNGPMEQAWVGYQQASRRNKPHIAKIVEQPKTSWMGAWIPDDQIYDRTRDYIENSQAGDPRKVVTIASFRMQPWYHAARRGKPTRAQTRSYRRWISEQVRAIGSTPTIVIVQPDMPFLMTARHKRSFARLIKWGAKQYATNRNTKVYLEAGAYDWPAPGQGGAQAAVRFLKTVGIEYAHGIALNSTHYSDPNLEILRSKEIIDLLRKQGVRRPLRSVINTATSGNPWDFGTFQFKGPADEAPACTSPKQFGRVTCVSLGIPPTFDVTRRHRVLTPESVRIARRYVDGFLWFGRPWLKMQNKPFLEKKAVNLVKYSPFFR